jgi:hypothetical protein
MRDNQDGGQRVQHRAGELEDSGYVTSDDA